MSRSGTYDFFWIDKTLTSVEARRRELQAHYLANSAYIRYGNQLFCVKEIKIGIFEEIKLTRGNLKAFDRKMRVSELRDQCDGQPKRYSARRALYLEEVVVIESVLSGHGDFYQPDEDLSIFKKPSDNWQAKQELRDIKYADEVNIANTINRYGNIIFEYNKPKELDKPGGVARVLVKKLQNMMQERGVDSDLEFYITPKLIERLPDSPKEMNRLVELSKEEQKGKDKVVILEIEEIVENFLSKANILLLLGDPGAGKSLLLWHLIKQRLVFLSSELKETKEEKTAELLQQWLPIYLELKNYTVDGLRKAISDYIKGPFGKFLGTQACEKFESKPDEKSSEPKLLVILDSWDELQNLEENAQMIGDIYNHCMQNFDPERLKMIVSSRRHCFSRTQELKIFGDDKSKHRYELIPFNQRQMEDYINNRIYDLYVLPLSSSGEIKEILKKEIKESPIKCPGSYILAWREQDKEENKLEIHQIIAKEEIQPFSISTSQEQKIKNIILDVLKEKIAIDRLTPLKQILLPEKLRSFWNLIQIKEGKVKKGFSSAADYLKQLQSPNLKSVIGNPLLLRILVEVLPLLSERDNSSITRFQLYRAFHWQLILSNLNRRRTTLRKLQKSSDLESLCQDFHRWSMYLAIHLFNKNTLNVEFDEPPKDKVWTALLKQIYRQSKIRYEKESAVYAEFPLFAPLILEEKSFYQQVKTYLFQLQHFLPLVKSGQNYSFWHKSFYEYLIAELIFFPVSQYAKENLFPTEESQRSEIKEILKHRPMQQEPEILRFLKERWDSLDTGDQVIVKETEQSLFKILEESKESKEAKIEQAAANAITILHAVGVSLIGKNFKGIRIPGAYLRGARLAHSDFSNAYLREATLSRTMLYKTNLQQADLSDVIWGEALLEYQTTVSSIAFGPDTNLTRRWLAVTQGNMIEIHDLGQQSKQIHKLAVGDSKDEKVGDLIEQGQEIKGTKLKEAYVHEKNKVTSISFSSNGRWLAAGSEDCHVWLWDLSELKKNKTIEEATPEERHTLSKSRLVGHSGAVLSISFSSDSRWLASGGDDMNVRLWDMKENSPKSEVLTGHSGSILSVSFSPDALWLASGSNDGSVWIWNVRNHQTKNKPLIECLCAISSVVFSPNVEWLAVGDGNNIVQIFKIEIGRAKDEKSTEYLRVMEKILLNAEKGCLAIEKSSDIGLRNIEEHLNAAVSSMSFSPDGCWLAWGSWDNSVRLWNMKEQCAEGELIGHLSNVSSVSFSSDGHWLASGGWDNRVRLWDMSELRVEGETSIGHTKGVQSMSFNPKGFWLVSGSSDGSMQLWNVKTCRAEGEPLLTGHSEILSVSFSSNGCWLASGDSDGCVRLWNVKGQSVESQPEILPLHSRKILSVSFVSPEVSPYSYLDQIDWRLDKHWLLVSASSDKTIHLWNMKEQRMENQSLKLTGDLIEEEEIRSIAFNQDGHWLASGSSHGMVRLWNLEKYLWETFLREKEEYQIEGQLLITNQYVGVSSISFSQNKWLACGNSNGVVQLWSIEDFISGVVSAIFEPSELEGHSKEILSLSFNPNEDLLASGSRDNTVRLWLLGIYASAPKCIQVLQWGSAILTLAFSSDLILAMADELGLVSFWYIKASTQAEPQLIGLPSNTRMILWAGGARIEGSHMSSASRRLLQQVGAEEKINDKKIEQDKKSLKSIPVSSFPNDVSKISRKGIYSTSSSFFSFFSEVKMVGISTAEIAEIKAFKSFNNKLVSLLTAEDESALFISDETTGK